MAKPINVLILNQISQNGLKRLPAERYQVGKDIANPDAVMVRSADMHKMDIPKSVQAIARAGAGTNNIPVKAMSACGRAGCRYSMRPAPMPMRSRNWWWPACCSPRATSAAR
jgi:hypothetical protein